MGCLQAVLIGMFDFALRPIRISIGLGIALEIGVVRRHRRARSGSALVWRAFVRVILIVRICRSMKPLDLGYLGDEVVWSNDHSRANLSNASPENCGPLSLMSFVGMPCSAKICFSALMIVLLLMSRPSFLTAKYLL